MLSVERQRKLALWPAGWEESDLPQTAGARARVGRAGQKYAEPDRSSSAMGFDLGDYAAAFLIGLLGAFVGGLGVAFFSVWAFSLAANSCLTLAVIAATSTL